MVNDRSIAIEAQQRVVRAVSQLQVELWNHSVRWTNVSVASGGTGWRNYRKIIVKFPFGEFNCEVTRTQFPLRLAYAVNIDRSQGQQYEDMLLTHGHLYH